jgi:hypothetical protein
MPRSTRCAALLAFRQAAFACLGRRQDALFELIDAASCGGAADSLPHLSIVPLHKEGKRAAFSTYLSGVVTDVVFSRSSA